MKRPTYGTLTDPSPPPPSRFARCMAYVSAHPLPSLVLAGSIGFSVGFVLATVWLTTH